MKVRTGFVSNSSSTSFVVCLKPDEDLETWKPSIQGSLNVYKRKEGEKYPLTARELVDDLKKVQEKGWGLEQETDRDSYYFFSNFFSQKKPDNLIRTKEVRDDEGYFKNFCTEWMTTKMMRLFCGVE